MQVDLYSSHTLLVGRLVGLMLLIMTVHIRHGLCGADTTATAL